MVREYISQYQLATSETEYINMHTKMKFICACGNEFVTNFNRVVRDNKTTCLKCSHDKLRRERSFSYEFVKKYIEENGCKLLECEYINANTKIKVECGCGNVYTTTFHSFKDNNKYRCDICSKKSLGENRVEFALMSLGASYSRQHKFDDCIRRYVAMPFDFYLEDVNTCIEYDGEQHFKEVSHWGGIDRLKAQQKNDEFKNNYCKENGIKLIRIPYWDFDNIEEIIKRELVL